MFAQRSPLVVVLALICAQGLAQEKLQTTEPILECPNVMAHTVDRTQHPGWTIYSNMPVRLTGADIEYFVDEHYEATFEPDESNRLNDDNLSTAKVFDLTKHREAKDLSLVCHYGVHAQLSRAIPKNIRECTIVHRGRFDETKEGEFRVFCE